MEIRITYVGPDDQIHKDVFDLGMWDNSHLSGWLTGMLDGFAGKIQEINIYRKEV